ncbi:MAG TPA: efflux RND transporter periplasmic adaptor subunit [archaeon]|nr:efflux RND transporter periplasmic adaptor subunit [archaeon]
MTYIFGKSWTPAGTLRLIFLLFLIAASFFLCCKKGNNAPAGKDAKADSTAQAEKDSLAAEREAAAVPVEISPMRRGDVYDYILQNATVDTEEGVEVYSKLMGVMVELRVEEGDHVSQGSVLCRLEDDAYRLARDKAKVAYDRQSSDFKRYQDMYKKELTSVEQFEQARFNLDQARLDWERAELDLKHTRITAPISGVVTNRHVRLGERLTTSMPLFKIVGMAEKIAVVYIPERETVRVRHGQPAYLSTDNLPDMRFNAVVKRISPAVDASSGTFKVTVGVSDPEENLRPGMFVSVHIVTDTHKDALLIPKAAVIYENGLPYVFFVDRDTLARRVRLERGFSDEQYVEVLSAVGETDQVIVVGQNGLKDGARIKVVAGLFEESGQDSVQVAGSRLKSSGREPGAETALLSETETGTAPESEKDVVPPEAENTPGSPAGAPAPSSGLQPDTDRDGVPDSLDLCPDTPEGQKVDDRGCPVLKEKARQEKPAAPSVSAAGRASERKVLETDTPEVAMVDKSGDSDVYTDSDSELEQVVQTAQSSSSSSASENGSLQIDPGEFPFRVFFDLNKARLKVESYRDLDRIAEFMKAEPRAKLQIIGCSDRGAEKSYLELSNNRAQAVRDYLTGQGVEPGRLTVFASVSSSPGENRDVSDKSMLRCAIIRLKR